ncbi:MAG: TonB-dependent receptor [Bacteroidales bacterium]|nr:TonB-dependent receptor [Bacteroidales bacterium]
MKKFLKFCLVGILLLSQIQFAIAQEKSISGTVTESSGVLLPGVNIVVRGTTIGTISDQDGNFTITVPDENAVLVFSFIGYLAQEVTIGNQTIINPTLVADVVGLEELVVVGYGTRKKVNLTGAVATVQAEELDKITSVNATNLLEGQMSGVITKQTSGQPGEDNTSISIRGFGNPLILIDGEERSLNSIDPKMIESISVLKDASAAIYGARSGNGVILVTTKRGKKGQSPRINYEGSYSIQQFTHKPGLITDAGRYTEFWVEAEENVGISPTYTPEEIQKWYDGGPGYKSYDWFDWTYKNWAPRQKHNLSVQGGSDNISYYVGLGVSDQQSVVSSDDWWYKRYNILSNIDGDITDNLSFSLDLSFSHEHQSETGNIEVLNWVYKTQPMAPTSFEGSDLTPASNLIGTHQRVVGGINKDIQGGTDRIPNKFNGRFELAYEFPFVAGLSARASMDYRMVDRRTVEVKRQWEVYTQDPETGEILLDGRFPADVVNNGLWVDDYLYTRLKPKVELRFNRNFGDHSVDGLLLGEYFDDVTNEINTQTQNLLSNDLMYLGLGEKVYHELGQRVEESSRASIAGRVNYGFKGKYLAEATFRYDASSFFPPDTRWGFFPSFSAGWRVSEESFMSDLAWLDNLKLRGSYCETGYDLNAVRYDYFAGYNVRTSPLYLMGSDAYRRLQIGTLPNNSMTWEKMTNYNVGVDLNMWNGLLNLVVEGFYRKRSDILATPQQTFPSTFGASLSQRNLNSLDDRGFEFELSHINQVGDVNYSIRGIFTYAKSKWIHYEEEEYTDEEDIRILQKSGNWVNRSIGYVSDGLFRSQAEIDEHTIDQDQAGNNTLIPGDIKYKDLNGDGIITWADQEYIGYGIPDPDIDGPGEPDLNFGLNLGVEYKGVSLGVLVQGGSMYCGNISGLARVPYQNNSSPFEIHWQERFHEVKNPDGTQPAVSIGLREHNDKFSDFWLRSITYLRLENANLSYTFPKEWLSPVGIKNLNIYVAAQNLAVISNLGIWASEFDPEAPLNNNNYPPHRTITFGVNVTF